MEIVRALSEFFTPNVPDLVRTDLAERSAWVVTAEEHVIGFGIVDEHFAGAAEIVWAAVDSDRRGQGAGTALVNQILDELKTRGVALVVVKTLDRSVDYASYEATRAFWERRGFRQIDTLDPLPGWEPGNPAAVYVAALRPTR